MLWRYGEVKARNALRCGVLCALHQVLLDSLASTLLVVVECNQTLWFSTVVKTRLDDCRNDSLVVCEIYARSLQLLVEGELLDILQEGVDALTSLVVIHKLEQLLKHTGCRTRRRYKLYHFELLGNCVVVFYGVVALLLGEYGDTILGRSSLNNFERRETTLECLDLSLYLCHGQAVSFDFVNLIFVKHNGCSFWF